MCFAGGGVEQQHQPKQNGQVFGLCWLKESKHDSSLRTSLRTSLTLHCRVWVGKRERGNGTPPQPQPTTPHTTTHTHTTRPDHTQPHTHGTRTPATIPFVSFDELGGCWEESNDDEMRERVSSSGVAMARTPALALALVAILALIHDSTSQPPIPPALWTRPSGYEYVMAVFAGTVESLSLSVSLAVSHSALLSRRCPFTLCPSLPAYGCGSCTAQ